MLRTIATEHNVSARSLDRASLRIGSSLKKNATENTEDTEKLQHVNRRDRGKWT
jgi:hypothetical protein